VTQTPDFATKPTLTGDRVILRPYVESDLPSLQAALADLDVLRLTGSIHAEAEAFAPITPEEEKLRVDWFNSRNDTDDRLDLAVVDKASGDCVGEAVLNN
jgi:RimJ/RimL family protein N-acetyltransferase